MTFDDARERMVAEQIEARGCTDPRVLAAMRCVPRHLFVPEDMQARAYEDNPLPIGQRQTISQPYMVAVMTAALDLPRRPVRVLEVGTGSGYQAAVLAAMGVRVVSLERLAGLAARARTALAELGLEDRVTVVVTDGGLGWPADAPYDGALVTAAAPGIPRPLLDQLAPGAPLVLPIGDEDQQTLVRLRQGPDGWREEYLGECRFVKLRGSQGWDEA